MCLFTNCLHPKQCVSGHIFLRNASNFTHSHRRIYHWAIWAMPPPFELRKISHMAKTYNLREVARGGKSLKLLLPGCKF